MRAAPRSCCTANRALLASEQGIVNKENLDSIVRIQASASRGSSVRLNKGGCVPKKSEYVAAWVGGHDVHLEVVAGLAAPALAGEEAQSVQRAPRPVQVVEVMGAV